MPIYSIFPTFAPTELIRPLPDPTVPIEYPPSWLFDFARGDFVKDSSGRPLRCDGWTAWVQWCFKTVLTPRFQHLIYSSDYGTEFEHIPSSDRTLAEAHITTTVRDALTIDRRTASVVDFAFEWEGDGVRVSFTPIPTLPPPTPVETRLSFQATA